MLSQGVNVKSEKRFERERERQRVIALERRICQSTLVLLNKKLL